MHVFSFSSFGTNPRYRKNIEANFESIKKIPNACMLLYTNTNDLESNVPLEIKVVTVKTDDVNESYFWRFINVIPGSVYFHCRDIDSVISDREIELLSTLDKDYYCIRDHEWHASAPYPIQGGMWGAKFDSTRTYQWNKLVSWWIENKKPFEYYSDMWFLTRYLYPFIQRDGIEFDGCGSRWGGTPITIKRKHEEDYIGKVV